MLMPDLPNDYGYGGRLDALRADEFAHIGSVLPRRPVAPHFPG